MKRPLFFLVSLSIVGCAHMPPRSPTGLTPRAFWKDQARRAEMTSQISGKLTLSYQTKSRSVSGKGRLLAKMPGQLRLELRDPLGRLQYVLTLAGRRLVAYYPSQKVAYLDDQSGRAYLHRFMSLGVTMEELQSLFVGLLPNSWPKEFVSWEWDPATGYYRGELSGKERRVTAFVDGARRSMARLELVVQGEAIRADYSDFEPCCGNTPAATKVAMAQSISIHLVKSQSGVEVEWHAIEPLAGSPEPGIFKANLPDGARRIYLD